MKQSITMDWDRMSAVGNHKKSVKGGPFVSRVTGRDANGNRPSTLGKVRGLQFHEKVKLEKTAEIPVQKSKEGIFYYQARIAGKFGKRIEISATLAKKLGI